MKKKQICIILFIVLLSSLAIAHSGRTDSKGGHYNRATGEYHYHHGYPAHKICGNNCPYRTRSIENTSNSDWDFNSLLGLSIVCLWLGYISRFLIFLPLLIIDNYFNKTLYEKFVFEHTFLSSLLSGIPFFLVIYFI